MTKPETKLYTFEDLQVEIPKVPTSVITNLQQAKILFAVMQKWIKRGRLYYTLRDFPLQYVNLCLDLSELYRFVAFYEEDIDVEYTVQKKRYDALETLSTILKEVRPNCYVTVSMELTKEIIEVQMELMNLNLKKLCTTSEEPKCDVPVDSLRKQINVLSTLHHKLENVSSTLNTSTINPEPEHTLTQKPVFETDEPSEDDGIENTNEPK